MSKANFYECINCGETFSDIEDDSKFCCKNYETEYVSDMDLFIAKIMMEFLK